jgi:hypothetical protein
MQSKLPLTIKPAGLHGDHWAGLFGFQNFYDDNNGVQSIVMQIGEFATEQYKSTPADVMNIPLAEDLYATVVLENGLVKTMYPVIMSDTAIATTTQRIEEWENGKEGQILAHGADIYQFEYFATDYTAHKDKYLDTPQHNTVLASVLYMAAKPVSVEGFADDMTYFLPNTDYPGSSLYNFRGQITAVRKSANPDLFIDGYILTLKIATGEGNDLFVDSFLSFDNIQTENVSKDAFISGVFWLQGRIV